jgi:hypothetical protein
MIRVIHLLEILLGSGITLAALWTGIRAVRRLEGSARREDLVIALWGVLLGLGILLPRL